MTKYRTIAADPPWPLAWRTGKTRVNGRGERHRNLKRELGYPVMSIEDICALPVYELAAEDCRLFLWVPDQFLIDGSAKLVAECWGFQPGRTMIWWAKTGYGLGDLPRPQHEGLLVCRQGSPEVLRNDVGSVHEWKVPYEGGARKHSAKPDGAYDLIQSCSPGPYLELFSRTARLGWDTHGDESLGGVELPESVT